MDDLFAQINAGQKEINVVLKADVRGSEEAVRNALEKIDYEKALALKWEYAEIIYQNSAHKFKASKDYQQFYQQNEDWLKAYAAFSY